MRSLTASAVATGMTPTMLPVSPPPLVFLLLQLQLLLLVQQPIWEPTRADSGRSHPNSSARTSDSRANILDTSPCGLPPCLTCDLRVERKQERTAERVENEKRRPKPSPLPGMKECAG